MADTRYNCSQNNAGRDTACIEAARILDSCRDRDCYENVKVFLSSFGNDIIRRTTNIRVTDACIAWANISVDPIPFNRGFYTVNVRLYIKVSFEACVGRERSQCFDGIAVVDKKAVLYGGENNVTVFKSTGENDFCSAIPLCCSSGNLPTATVELVDPIVLSVGVYEKSDDCKCCCCCCCSDVPETVFERVDGVFGDDDDYDRFLAVSIGIFSVIKITRTAQYLVHATEVCVPDKECVSQCEDDPCGIFRTMAFPIGEFCSSGSCDGVPVSSTKPERRCSCNS